MSIGYNNMNMYMYGNNGFGNLLKQGMGMLSGGYGIGGANYFTNCYGEVNYDKMAGFQVANALLGTTFQAIAANKANKASEPQVNYTQELNAVAKEINTKEDELSSKNGELETLGDEFKESANKSKSVSTLQSELTNAEADVTKNSENLKNLEAKNPKPTDYEAQKIKINNDITAANDKVTKLKADIETKKKYEAKELEIAKVKDEIAELEKKQDTLQKAANDKAIDDAKSNKWQRSDIGCLDKWQKSAGEETQMASKKDLERASYEFRKGAKTPAKRYEAANAFVNMYESNEVEFKGKYSALYTAIKAWRNDPKNKIN